MRLHRFFTTTKLTADLVYTNQAHIHQWKNVFRYESGASIILFGDGFEHTYTIDSLTKKEAVLREVSKESSRFPETELTLAISLIKRDNFEMVLQKCTELGVTSFIPLVTERSFHKMYAVDRLEKILVEATEQSGWGRVPKLLEVSSLDKVLTKECVVLEKSGREKLPDSNKILLIGPEGGWSEGELEKIEEKKTQTWSLKTGVLRAETAAIVATGIIKNTC